MLIMALGLQRIRSCSSFKQSLSIKYVLSTILPMHCLKKLFIELQANTQYYGRRPFGVGLVIAGYDVCLSLPSNVPSFHN